MCSHSHKVPEADQKEIQEVSKWLLKQMAIIVAIFLTIVAIVWSIPGVKEWIKNHSAYKENAVTVAK